MVSVTYMMTDLFVKKINTNLILFGLQSDHSRTIVVPCSVAHEFK